MYAVKNEREILIITDDFDFAETYTYDWFNRHSEYVVCVNLDTDRVLLELGMSQDVTKH